MNCSARRISSTGTPRFYALSAINSLWRYTYTWQTVIPTTYFSPRPLWRTLQKRSVNATADVASRVPGKVPVASTMMEAALAVVQDGRPICRPQLSSRLLPGPNVAQTSRSSFSPSFKSWRVRVGQPPAAKLTPTSSTLRLRCTRLRSFSAAAARSRCVT